MSIYVCEAVKLHKPKHAKIDFANVKTSPDTKLFIDPCLIALGRDPWSVQANQVVQSYFDQFYYLYRSNAPDKDKFELFKHVHEINATHLGYGNGNNGKAKTPEGMMALFKNLPTLLRKGIPLSSVCDLPLFIDGFAEDCLSDMLTNILLKELMEFTVNQCERYSIPTDPAPANLFYWNSVEKRWEKYIGPCKIFKGKLLLLVPKNIVRPRFYFTAEQYFRGTILTRMREESAWRDKNGKVQYLPKKELRKNALSGDSVLTCIERLTSKDPTFLLDYHSQLPIKYMEKGMTDEALDKYLYH